MAVWFDESFIVNAVTKWPLYLLGLVIIFLILEFAVRYKGAYYSILTLLGTYGIFMVQSKIRGKSAVKA